ncbi:hypothetical protein I553_6564 [Mycobacterium xenopi 4042]|uniref:Uncharacterized protein n=1 Tax=Mycobacterium xenopi 4042 TaxID=1299334 RepID=X8BFQ6_MYCXE|nr:hypothetical protein I553_6564 [Mycobacterium xenopi 4042]
MFIRSWVERRISLWELYERACTVGSLDPGDIKQHGALTF